MEESVKDEILSMRLSGLSYKDIVAETGGKVSLDQCKRRLKGINPYPIQNSIREEFSEAWDERDEEWPLWIDDIVTGVSRLDWYGDKDGQIPLSTTSLINCFIWLDTFTLKGVCSILDCSERMGYHYLKACLICLPHLSKSLSDNNIRSMRYPKRQFVNQHSSW